MMKEPRAKTGVTAVTAAVLLLMIPAIMTSDALIEWLQFDRSAILAGEYWRLFTGHLVHWSFNHLFWDLLAGLLAVLFLLTHHPRTLIPLSLWSMVLVASFILLVNPEIAVYRGLSGLDTALFAYVGTSMALSAAHRRQGWILALAGMLLGLMTGKILYEINSGACLFVDSQDFIPLYTAHLGGLLAGSSYALGACLAWPKIVSWKKPNGLLRGSGRSPSFLSAIC
jgi:rhomboid family GlyGly-CTERM serine protease